MTTRSTSAAQSKSNARLLLFAVVSTLLCVLALVNVASASAAKNSGEDQYVEAVPHGGGDGDKGTDETSDTLGGQNGTVTEGDVQDAAEKEQKKKKKKQKKDKKDDEGSSGPTGAVPPAGSGTPPASTQAVDSTATAAKIGPFSRNTALLLGVMVLGIGGAAAVMHLRKPPLSTGS